MTAKKKGPRKEPFGRPTKYKEEFCEQMVDYFSQPNWIGRKKGNDDIKEAKEFPTFVEFASKIKVHDDTLSDWVHKHPTFSRAYKHCEKLQTQCITQNAFTGRYNAAFAMFFLKCNRGWNDNQVQEHNHSVEAFKIVEFDDKKD